MVAEVLDNQARQIQLRLKVLHFRLVHPPSNNLDGGAAMKIVALGAMTSRPPVPAIMFNIVVRRWRRRIARLFDPYKPELHYMRGPGPRWREKYGPYEHAG